MGRIEIRKDLGRIPHSTLYSMDVQRMSFWDIAITIRMILNSLSYSTDIQRMYKCPYVLDSTDEMEIF